MYMHTHTTPIYVGNSSGWLAGWRTHATRHMAPHAYFDLLTIQCIDRLTPFRCSLQKPEAINHAASKALTHARARAAAAGSGWYRDRDHTSEPTPQGPNASQKNNRKNPTLRNPFILEHLAPIKSYTQVLAPEYALLFIIR